ncbi:MAG: response regulator [Myxococcota bacterium]|nr:response regulator [Myxococcota bacterium]
MTEPTLLVVDPNPATVRRIEEAFAGLDLRVCPVRDAMQADAVLDGMNLVAALLSASLPRGNGYELARRLRERFPATAILLMTGGFEVYNRTRASESGVTGHLGKPFTTDAVRDAVQALIGPIDAIAAQGARASAPASGASAAAAPAPAPPTTAERVATILPRAYQDVPVVAVDPGVVGPALERAVMAVLPEVVEALLRQSLVTSPAFRELVSVAVEDAVRAQLPAIASRVVEDRLAMLESTISHTD